MTPNELDELVVRKFPLGHPVVSIALAESNTLRWMVTKPSQRGVAVLGDLLFELPDILPRTGDCAELLFEPAVEPVL